MLPSFARPPGRGRLGLRELMRLWVRRLAPAWAARAEDRRLDCCRASLGRPDEGVRAYVVQCLTQAQTQVRADSSSLRFSEW